jgi:hypothetical protein
MILLAGASLGGTAVMVAAPSVSPPVAAAVSLSGEADLESFFPGAGLDVVLAVCRAASAASDHAQSRGRLHLRARCAPPIPRSGREREEVVHLPGSYRGWDLLNAAPNKECASRILLDFLRGYS